MLRVLRRLPWLDRLTLLVVVRLALAAFASHVHLWARAGIPEVGIYLIPAADNESCPIIPVLKDRIEPLASAGWARGSKQVELSPFERAVLEILDVASLTARQIGIVATIASDVYEGRDNDTPGSTAVQALLVDELKLLGARLLKAWWRLPRRAVGST